MCITNTHITEASLSASISSLSVFFCSVYSRCMVYAQWPPSRMRCVCVCVCDCVCVREKEVDRGRETERESEREFLCVCA